MLRVCHHYRWLHSYVLIVCRQHRRPAFVRVAKPRWYALLFYILTCCSYAINIVDLRSYALLNLVGTHHCPTFVHAARLMPLPMSTFVVYRQHRLPAFVRIAELHWYTPLSYIRTCCASAAIAAGYIRMCCSSAVNIIDLRSYALQNLVDTHCCPTFVRAARLLSSSSTCIRTHCRASLVPSAVLHSYALLVCRQHRRPAFARIVELRWYPLLSYIRTRCYYAVNTADLYLYALQKLVGTHCCPTFVRAASMQSTPLTCNRTHCRSSLVHTAVLHSYTQRVCRHCHWLHLYVLQVCRQHR